jgi:hypothetical protein
MRRAQLQSELTSLSAQDGCCCASNCHDRTASAQRRFRFGLNFLYVGTHRPRDIVPPLLVIGALIAIVALGSLWIVI